jgi:lipoic acid synthetase
MLGLGETAAEIQRTLVDIRAQGCELLTIGQYLRPSPAHLPVQRYAEPAEFEHWERMAREIGFREVASGALVRSSYRAERLAGRPR